MLKKALTLFVFIYGACMTMRGQADRALIEGQVVDPSGAALYDAQVWVARNGWERTVMTDADGRFRFSGLPPATYDLRIRHQHFTSVQRRVKAGAGITTLRVVMRLEEVREQITVADSAVAVSTDAGNNAGMVRLDGAALDALPALDDDVLAAAARFLDDPLIGTGEPALIVDGLETDKLGVSRSAIQEVRVNRDPYSAEFFRSGRGRIEVITKQEPAEFHGSLRLRLRDYHLDARNAFADRRPEQQRRGYEGHITGPLGRSRRHSFLLSAEHDDDQSRSLIYARTPQGLVQDQAPAPERETEFSARWNYRPVPEKRWSLRYEWEREAEQNQGVGGFNLPDLAASQTGLERALYIDHQAFLSTRSLAQFQGRLRYESAVTDSLRTGMPRIVVEDAFATGSAQEHSFASELRGEFSGVISWSGERHYLRAGTSLRDAGRRGVNDRGGRIGEFRFSSLEDYAAQRPFSFTRQEGDGRAVFFQQEHGFFVQDQWKPRPNLSLGLGLRYDRQTYPSDNNNLAPRLSVAWSPGASGRLVLRGGAGLFYDEIRSGAIRETLLLDGRHLRRLIVTEPGYPDPFGAGGTVVSPPPVLVRFASGLRSPYLIHSSFAVERQLFSKATLSVSFNSVEGRKLFRSRDVNPPLGPDSVRPDPAASVIRQIESSAGLRARSVQIALRGQAAGWLSGVVRYTAGRAYNDTGGMDALPANSLDLSGEWARANNDRLHRFLVAGNLEIKSLFRLGVTLEASSGRPYSLTTGTDDNRDGSASDRPAGVPRNSLTGPGAFDLDVRWSRDFRLGSAAEGPVASLVLDAFNALNQVNPAGYVGNLSSPFFGRAVAARSARRMQVGLRLRF